VAVRKHHLRREIVPQHKFLLRFGWGEGGRGSAYFTTTDGSAVLPANYTFTAGDAGVHVISATLKTAGIQSISATDTVSSSITGTCSSITVNP
jgi:hypothetical protein